MALFNLNCFMNINFAQPRFTFGCFTMPNFFSNFSLFGFGCNGFNPFGQMSYFQPYYTPTSLQPPSVFGYMNNLPPVNYNLNSNLNYMPNFNSCWGNYNIAPPQFDTFRLSGVMPENKPKKVTYDSSKDKNATANADYIEDLTSEMQERTKKLIAYANENGYDVQITSGYRTEEEQNALKEKYKNESGRVANKSAHCEGKAIDIKVTKDGKESDAGYELLGEYAKNNLDMRWGGDFTSYRERWHFDYDWV